METPFYQRSMTARLEAVGRDRESPGYRALLFWGIANCVLVFAQQYINFILNPLGVQKFTYISTGLWVATTLWTRRAPMRVPFFIGLMLVLQIWLAFTSLRGQLVLGTMTVPNAMDFLWLVYVLGFMQAALLVWFAPESRKIFGLITILISVASSFTAFLQFAGFGPALKLGEMIRQADIIFAANEFQEVVRAPGLHSAVGNAVVWPCAAALMVGIAIKYRPIKWYDVMAITMMLGSAFIIQIRNQMLLILICTIWIVTFTYRRYGGKVLTLSAMAVMGVVGLVLINSDRFAYLLEGTNTLDYRQQILWPQAQYVLREQPFFGIGVEPAFAGWTTQTLPNKWMNKPLIDNGFYLIGIWGGYPGIALLSIMLAVGLASSIVALHRPNEDYWHEAFKLATVALMIFMVTGMYWGSLFANPVPVGVMFVCAGMSMSSHLSRRSIDQTGSTMMEAAQTA